MNKTVKNIARFFLFIFLQVFVLNKIPPLHHLVVPHVYFLFILWLPFNSGKRSLMLLSFLLGLCLDYFTKTPGLHAAACVLVAYLRPFIIAILIPHEGADSNYGEPSIKSMGLAPYFTYVAVLTFVHHAFLFLLEALEFPGFYYFIIKTFLSLFISLLIILIIELLIVRSQRFRTNTV